MNINSKKRLVIDCFKLVKGKGNSIGIYNYTKHIVDNMANIIKDKYDDKYNDLEIIIFGNKYNKNDFDIQGVNFIEISFFNPMNLFHCLIWELVYVSIMCKKISAAKVFYPRGFASLFHKIDDYITIHDCIPFYYNEHYPDYFSKIKNRYIMSRLKYSAKHCKLIFTISEYSKKQIIKYCKVDDKKIKVIYNGIKNENIRIEKKACSEKYITAMTSYLPHKNAKGIIDTYCEYYKITISPLKLHIIGIDEDFIKDIPSEIKSNIVFHKYIESDYKLKELIAGSELFIFMSFVEGFGFPPLEAMVLGVPVLCSNNSSLTEVVGDAGMFFEQNNYADAAKKIADVIENEKIGLDMVKKGYENIEKFSWNSASKKCIDYIVNYE